MRERETERREAADRAADKDSELDVIRRLSRARSRRSRDLWEYEVPIESHFDEMNRAMEERG